MDYAREAAEFSTIYQMQNMEFAVNHYGEADVAMFDFTSMYAAENASRIVERSGFKLLMCLVGDSLLEPFWPTGSGISLKIRTLFMDCPKLTNIFCRLCPGISVIVRRMLGDTWLGCGSYSSRCDS